MSTLEELANRKRDNQLDCPNPASRHVLDADCRYETGKFVLQCLPKHLPALFSLRFTAPEAFSPGDVLAVGAQDFAVKTLEMNDAGAGAFAAGAVVRCEFDADRGMAFIGGTAAGIASAVPVNEKIFEQSGTFVAPKSGYYRVTCIGGGGGGGGGSWVTTNQMCVSGGSGGSGYLVNKTLYFDAAEAVDIAVGLGGNGGSAATNATAGTGEAGGDTVVKTVTASGGQAGTGGGSGGVGSFGTGGINGMMGNYTAVSSASHRVTGGPGFNYNGKQNGYGTGGECGFAYIGGSRAGWKGTDGVVVIQW